MWEPNNKTLQKLGLIFHTLPPLSDSRPAIHRMQSCLARQMDQAQQPALSDHPTPIPFTQMWYYLNYDDAHLHINRGEKYLFATENSIRNAKTSAQKRLTLRGGGDLY